MNDKDNRSALWQGYVAAVASLAQAMLFLLAILSLAMNQIAEQIRFDGTGRVTSNGNLIGSDGGERLSPKPAQPPSKPEDPLTAEPAPHPVFDPARATQAVSNALPRAQDVWSRPGTPIDGRFQIVFSADRQSIPSEVRTQLIDRLRERSSVAARWHVWARVPTDDSALKRAAYLRLLAVRSVLLAAGVAASDMDIELLDGGSQDDPAADMAVHMDQVPSPMDEPSERAREPADRATADMRGQP